jgi:hypothetical protein
VGELRGERRGRTALENGVGELRGRTAWENGVGELRGRTAWQNGVEDLRVRGIGRTLGWQGSNQVHDHLVDGKREHNWTEDLRATQRVLPVQSTQATSHFSG